MGEKINDIKQTSFVNVGKKAMEENIFGTVNLK